MPDSSPRLDYDHLAPTYNQRFVDSKMEKVAKALLPLAQSLHAERILEVGCGTGYWLARLEPLVSQALGLDLSLGMLDQAAQRKEQLQLVHGDAVWLPFSNAGFDMNTCVNALHHSRSGLNCLG